jgi:lipoyl(octanoyl) transferase
MEYEPAWDLQRRIQDRLVADKRSAHPTRPDHVMLLVEHPPVFTLGKSGDRENLLATDAELREEGATFVPIDRGGDITYHGPGQLVGYPILDLDRYYTDIHRYLRELEDVVIRTCADFGLSAGRVEGRTGVWMTDPPGEERKLCAMGIRCSRWVTMHGFALNVNTNLDHFNMIVPCGISDRGVSSLAVELGHPVAMRDVEDAITRHIGAIFASETRILEPDDANAYLAAYLD